MTLEILQAAKIEAIKEKNSMRKEALSAMIDACQKSAITSKGRVEITEQLVDETLIKYQKTIQEMIDTCPADRIELLTKYLVEMQVVKEYAPQLLTDKEEIRKAVAEILSATDIEILAQNKGKIMKTITPHFKGKADMKIVSQVVGEMLA